MSYVSSYIVEQTSILDTTPLDTDIVSPPSGYPTTVTASCKFNEEKEIKTSEKYIPELTTSIRIGSAKIYVRIELNRSKPPPYRFKNHFFCRFVSQICEIPMNQLLS